MTSLATMTRPKQKGFTLIELLVVISIVALLIAILLPALQSARESAKAVICQSKMRQMSVVTELYRVDFKSYFPPDALIERANKAENAYLPNPPYRYELLVKDYFGGTPEMTTNQVNGSKNPMMCVSNPAPAGMNLGQARDTGFMNGSVTGNYMITAQYGYNNSSIQYKILRQLKVAPSRAIMLLETQGANYYRTGAGAQYGSGMGTIIYFHPGDSMNVAAADGHVVASKATSNAGLLTDNLEWAATRTW